MAKYEEAYKITKAYEGGYVNDPVDFGGETFKGVSRRYYPKWLGWAVIDRAKTAGNFPDGLKNIAVLDELVQDFYLTEFWDKVSGTLISSQEVANEIFDTAVNMGVKRASIFLQQALNAFNNGGKRYQDVSEDGVISNSTLSALDSYLSQLPARHILKAMNCMQGCHYLERMRTNPSQEKYVVGWFNRVSIDK